MAKIKKIFRCSECGEEFPKWQGQCSTCKEWNTVDEVSEAEVQQKVDKTAVYTHQGYAGRSGFGAIQKLSDVSVSEFDKIGTGFKELDKVMSGSNGVVEGSVTLIGGDPGIGKSTILLQVVGHIADKEKKKVLYVSGEESLSQIKLRAERLKVDTSKIAVLSETNIENILEQTKTFKPDVLIIDSIQTMFTSGSTSKPGSTTQLRDTTTALTTFCKTNNVTSFVIGHVTKGGDIAGPKVLEHIVDTVLYFEGEKESKFRMLRSIKNRFGEVNEIAVFSMEEEGLKEETNPSAMFLNQTEEDYSGRAIVITKEGSKNLLVEVQALVAETAADITQRRSIGLERDRMQIIISVLQKRLGLPLWKADVFASAVSGLKITEPAVDLAVAFAILSSYHDKNLPSSLAMFGEIGLVGEVRSVIGGEERIKEALKQGIKHFIIPKANYPKNKKLLKDIKDNDIKITTVTSLDSMLEAYNSI